MNLYVPTPAEVRKFFVAVGTVLSMLIANGTLEGSAQTWALSILAFLNAYGVYKVGNFSPPAHAEDDFDDPAEVGLDFDPKYEPKHRAEDEEPDAAPAS